MARAKLTIPETFDFQTILPVRVTDLNYGGHLANHMVLAFCHEARIQWLNKFGWTEISVAGSGLIQTDAVVVYKSQAFLGDEIVVDLGIQEWNPRGFELVYRLSCRLDGRETARCKTQLSFFDYNKRKLAPIPEAFRKTVVG